MTKKELRNIAKAVSSVNGTPAGEIPPDVLLQRELGGFYRKKAIPQHRQKNPISPNQTDLVNWVLYDRVTTAAAANTAARNIFYNQPIGAAGKTKEDTNMEQVQRLPDPQWMNVFSIGFYFSAEMVLIDIQNFLNDYYHEFWVGTKIYSEGPLQQFPGGAGMYGVTTKTNAGAYSNGYPAIGNVWDLRVPPPHSDGMTGITILQGQSFHVDVIGTPFALAAAAAPLLGIGLDLMVFLTGVLSRGVQ